GTLRTYGIWDDELAERLVAVPGDLEQPMLGLGPEQFLLLANRVDAIYHSGAMVNFIYPYSALKKANVDGTREVLRLACTSKAKAVHHFSAVDIFLSSRKKDYVIWEQDSLYSDVVAHGYIQSKWVGERLVAIARDRGLNAMIYRPWTIMGHSTTGAAHVNDFF